MIGIRASCLEGIALEGIGMHFPLECFVKAKYKTCIELPYTYQGRTKGISKFNFNEVVNYIKHVSRLYKYKRGNNGR
jgi:hypothetical protein